jgi:hypothetical protein
MDVDDMILVSIDDHVVEPPDMFDRHVPARWADQAPRIVSGDDGVDRWVYRGRQTGVVGLNAVVSWPAEEWGMDPAGYAEMRPGVYDVDARVRDMDRNGILASMCFPTFAGFSAGHLTHRKDEVTVVMIEAYNDWHIDEWAAAHPGRFIPLAIVPTWDPELAAAEIRRVAAKGCRAVSMPELPHLEGLPSYHDMDFWAPVFRALCDTGTVMCLHIGQGFAAIDTPADAPVDNMMILACQVSVLAVQDLLWARPCTRTPTSLKLRNEIGIDIIAWECDYPHSDSFWPDAPERVHGELAAAGATDDEVHKITWGNACRFFGWDPFAQVPRERATVGALRATAGDVDTSIRSRRDWAALYAQRHAG